MNIITCALPSCVRVFVPHRGNQRYCSGACSAEAKDIHRANLASGRVVVPFFLPDELRPQRRCGGCRRAFVPTNRYQAFCTFACTPVTAERAAS